MELGSSRCGNPSKEPKDDVKQKVAACGSWRRRTLAVLAFVPFAATVVLSIHLICEYMFGIFILSLNLSSSKSL